MLGAAAHLGVHGLHLGAHQMNSALLVRVATCQFPLATVHVLPHKHPIGKYGRRQLASLNGQINRRFRLDVWGDGHVFSWR